MTNHPTILLTVGALKLRKWRNTKNISRLELAKMISADPDKPLTQHAVGKYERGESRPSLPQIQRIKRVTRNHISADDWLSSD